MASQWKPQEASTGKHQETKVFDPRNYRCVLCLSTSSMNLGLLEWHGDLSKIVPGLLLLCKLRAATGHQLVVHCFTSRVLWVLRLVSEYQVATELYLDFWTWWFRFLGKKYILIWHNVPKKSCEYGAHLEKAPTITNLDPTMLWGYLRKDTNLFGDGSKHVITFCSHQNSRDVWMSIP